MGVRDLSAVLLKHAPESTKQFKSLAAFKGKTLALDANLLTIKFHHRKPLPPKGSLTGSSALGEVTLDPNRHVKGWYELLSQLRKRKIRAIVVFDGSTRVPEKARENERRREGRELQRKRGEAEGNRADRLRQLKALWGEVEVEDRATVAREFVRLVSDADAAKEAKLSDDVDEHAAAAAVTPPQIPQSKEVPVDVNPPDGRLFSTADRLLRLYDSFKVDAPNPIYSKNQVVLTSSESLFFSHLLHLGMLERSQSPLVEGAADALAASLSVDLEPAPVAEVVVGEQQALVPPILDSSREDAQEMDVGLASLLKQSEKLGASHLSRAEKVPSHAFRDSLALIRALGVPHLLPSRDSPVEAESLCSTLCALGIADYVVSEDSDVTVYGAPLLRQIGVSAGTTTLKGGGERKKGMNVLDPKAVRKGLRLSHAAFVDFCLLCGTDFTDRIPTIGPMTALALVKRFKSIEAILAQHPAALPALESAGTTASEYLQTVHAARALFLTPAPLPEGLEDEWWQPKEPSEELEELLIKFGIKKGVPTKLNELPSRVEMTSEFSEEADDEDVISWADEDEKQIGLPPETGVSDEAIDRLAERMAGW